MSKPKAPQASNADLRSQLDADVAKFLKSGKKIQQIPTGVSSQDYSKGRKHIVLGKSRPQADKPVEDVDDELDDETVDDVTDDTSDDEDDSEEQLDD